MSETSLLELQQEMEKVRYKLHAFVNGDTRLLLNCQTYQLSTELDSLIVKIMRKEQEKKKC
ncbi:MAG: Spo0E family sporulation regulatory protein-aspartic acid phosphatase [Peptococcales bacterium]|jgi:hypothetical protein